MTHLTEHFTLEEMTLSQTAAREGINNTPDTNSLIQLCRLCAMLEFVRAALKNKAMFISSGYRCPALNSAVGGSSSSQHMTGQAVDFICPDFGTPYDVCKAIMAEPKIKFDQLIWEYEDWIHFSVPAIGVAPRMQALTINSSGTHNGIA